MLLKKSKLFSTPLYRKSEKFPTSSSPISISKQTVADFPGKIMGNYGINTPNIIKPKNAPILKQQEWKNIEPEEKYMIYKIYPDTDRDGVPDRWDCQPNNPRKQDFAKTRTGIPMADFASVYGYKKTHTFMHPNEFLRQTQTQGSSRIRAWPLGEYEKAVIQPVKVERLKRRIASPFVEVDVPLLETEKGRVVEHEGRHRAVAARELGYKKIPVVIVETGKKKIL